MQWLSSGDNMIYWDLKLIECNYFGFGIRASFYIKTRTTKLRFSDNFFYRCITVHFGAMGLECYIHIPLWKEV